MSETVTTTNNTVDTSKYMYQIRRLKDALATAVKDCDSFKAEADQYRKDNADLKLKWDESAIVKELESAKGQLKTIEYRKTWDRVAKAKGIRDDALDVLYEYGKFKPEDGEPDLEKIGTAIEEQKAKLPFLTAPKADATATTEKPLPKPAPGSGQGGKTAGGGTFQLPDDNDGRWNDNMWQWNHRDEIAEAIKEKLARGQV